MRFLTSVVVLMLMLTPGVGIAQQSTPEVVKNALSVLAEYGEKVPSVIVTDTAQNPQAAGKVGFALHPAGSCVPANSVYLVGDHELYQVAAKGYRVYIVLLSAVVLHESRHCARGDEVEAYSAEAEYITKHIRDTKNSAEAQILRDNLKLVEKQLEIEIAKKAARLVSSQQ